MLFRSLLASIRGDPLTSPASHIIGVLVSSLHVSRFISWVRFIPYTNNRLPVICQQSFCSVFNLFTNYDFVLILRIKNPLKHNHHHCCVLTDAYFPSGKHQCNIIIREQLLLLLLLSFVMNHFNHKSCVTVSYIYMSYQFISLFHSSKNFNLKISCHCVIHRGMYPSSFTNLQSIPLIFLDLRALLLLRAAPPPGG